MARWVTIEKLRAVGDNTPIGVILDCSYIVIKKEELERVGLEHLGTENHKGRKDCYNIHWGSGQGVQARTVKQARYKLIKDLSDRFEEQFGYRLWVKKGLDETLVV